MTLINYLGFRLSLDMDNLFLRKLPNEVVPKVLPKPAAVFTCFSLFILCQSLHTSSKIMSQKRQIRNFLRILFSSEGRRNDISYIPSYSEKLPKVSILFNLQTFDTLLLSHICLQKQAISL